jgi:hypothetical protein
MTRYGNIITAQSKQTMGIASLQTHHAHDEQHLLFLVFPSDRLLEIGRNQRKKKNTMKYEEFLTHLSIHPCLQGKSFNFFPCVPRFSSLLVRHFASSGTISSKKSPEHTAGKKKGKTILVSPTLPKLNRSSKKKKGNVNPRNKTQFELFSFRREPRISAHIYTYSTYNYTSRI